MKQLILNFKYLRILFFKGKLNIFQVVCVACFSFFSPEIINTLLLIDTVWLYILKCQMFVFWGLKSQYCDLWAMFVVTLLVNSKKTQ